MTSFSREIKELRECIKVDQIKFSELAQVPIGTLQEWEAGTNIPEEYLQRIVMNYLYRVAIDYRRKEKG